MVAVQTTYSRLFLASRTQIDQYTTGTLSYRHSEQSLISSRRFSVTRTFNQTFRRFFGLIKIFFSKGGSTWNFKFTDRKKMVSRLCLWTFVVCEGHTVPGFSKKPPPTTFCSILWWKNSALWSYLVKKSVGVKELFLRLASNFPFARSFLIIFDGTLWCLGNLFRGLAQPELFWMTFFPPSALWARSTSNNFGSVR